MNDRRTMTLNLSPEEMEALDALAQRKELSKTVIIRQALRLFQMIDARQAAGEKLVFEDAKNKTKSELLVLG